jgi:hypothetical protein
MSMAIGAMTPVLPQARPTPEQTLAELEAAQREAALLFRLEYPFPASRGEIELACERLARAYKAHWGVPMPGYEHV